MMPERKPKLRNTLWPVLLGAGLVVIAYIYLYQWQPLPAPWNDTLLAGFTTLVAIADAVAVTLIWRHFDRQGSGPRAVWQNLAVAFWLWALAEAIINVYYALGLEQPPVTVADAFWLAGYVFLGAALVHQYALVFHHTRGRQLGTVAAVVAAALVSAVVITLILQQVVPNAMTWFETLVNVLYPIGDLTVGIAALVLVFAFGGGAWGRPWLALFIFAIADTLYVWLELSGLYSSLNSAGSLLPLGFDTTYLIAYLVMGVMCYAQLQLLRHSGPAGEITEPPPSGEAARPPR